MDSKPISMTANAVSKVQSLKLEEENDALMLRLYITGGGCSGFSYGFTFEEDQKPDERPIHIFDSLDSFLRVWRFPH